MNEQITAILAKFLGLASYMRAVDSHTINGFVVQQTLNQVKAAQDPSRVHIEVTA